jgi:hypothetical protein
VTGLPNVSAVVFVGDVRKMAEFYRELAVMEVLYIDDAYAVLQLAGFQLVIHALRGAPKAGASEFLLREDSYIKLCLPVESIDGRGRGRRCSAGRSRRRAMSGRRVDFARVTGTIPKAT